MPISPHVADSWPVFTGELGAIPTPRSTSFTVWAPRATAVTLRLFSSGDHSEVQQEVSLRPMNDGAWGATVQQALAGRYYDYLVADDGGVRRTADPWAKACGVNGERSMVVNLADTDPEGWQEDSAPAVPADATMVWETHVGDFSNDPHSGFPAEHRGTYLAFTDEHTTVDGITGADSFATGLDYLKELGVTHIELMPIYDFGSVDEAKRGEVAGEYNWGYDPVTYNVPEGSYSTDPYDGATRIRECKMMIQSLHRQGFRVVMDVVYNHMYTAQNSFECMAPGYFCRRNAAGQLTNASGCGNDMASEHPMFGNFIVDSLCYWAREYHIDGFRFDLMGLIDVDTMNRARAALNRLPGGKDILMFGEPWAADAEQISGNLTLAGAGNTALLDQHIGWFCDATRDAIKGDVMHHTAPGFVNGEAAASKEYMGEEGSETACALQCSTAADAVYHAVDGWWGTEIQPQSAKQLVQYVSAHDDLTLWDKLCRTMRGPATESDFREPGSSPDMLVANAIAAGLIFTAAGTPFILSGEEFARTKLGCANSFNSSAEVNWLDWRRAADVKPLVAWYRTLASLRRSHPEVSTARHVRLRSDEGTVAYDIPDAGLMACANPCNASAAVSVPKFVASKQVTIAADSSNYVSFGGHKGCNAGTNRNSVSLDVPPHSFVVWEY